MENEDRYQRVNLRIPKELHARLQADADSKSRSVNAEIIDRLERADTKNQTDEGTLAYFDAMVFEEMYNIIEMLDLGHKDSIYKFDYLTNNISSLKDLLRLRIRSLIKIVEKGSDVRFYPLEEAIKGELSVEDAVGKKLRHIVGDT